jgi:hypothetical protein
VAVLAVLLGWRQIFGPDIGFQLAAGRAVLARGFRLGDDLTWTVAGQPYLDLQWLWQVAMVGAWRTMGTAGIVAQNLLLTLGALALLVLRSIRREGEVSPWLPLWLLVFAGANLWEVRPHAASWLLLGAVLLCLEGRFVWALPPLMAVWVNVHSLYVLGLVAIGLHALIALFREGRRARPLLLAGALALLACCLNPFGPQALLYPLRQLWEISGGSLYNRPDLGVVEFQSPWSLFEYTANGALVLLQPILFIHLGAALTALALLLGSRRLALVDWLLLAAFGFLLWQAEKNFGYFAVAVGPAVISGLSARTPSPRGATAMAGAVIAACLVLSLQIRSGWFYAQQRLPHRTGHAFNENFLPVRACAFLNARVPEGRLLNSWEEGGFVGFATGRRTFIDARTEVMGEALFRSYRRLLDGATLPFELPRWDPQIVLAPLAETPEWVAHFLASPDWRLVYADEQDFLFLRQGFAPGVAALDPPPVAPLDPQRIDRALERAIALRAPGPLATLHGVHHDPLIELRAVAAWLYRDQPAAALAAGIEGLERTTLPAPRLLRNVMLALAGVGDPARARRVHAALPPELQ